MLGGPKGRKARKAGQKAMMTFRVGFRRHQPGKGAGKDCTQNKGNGKDKNGKDKEYAHPQSGLSASETLNEEGYGHAWESDDWSASHWLDYALTSSAGWYCTKSHTVWMAANPLNLSHHPTHVVLDLGCTRSIGSRTAIEKFKKCAWY